MTTLENRPNSALLVIDVQNEVVAQAFKRDEIVANMATVVDKARATGIPVVWVQHSDEGLAIGSDDWQIVPELVPAEGEAIIHKTFRSSFEATDLEDVLAGLGAGQLIVTGAQTNFCVRNTVHAAFERGYDVTVIGDAHTTSDESWNGFELKADTIIDDFNLGFMHYDLPGRSVRMIKTADF
jgi:nicotinamidase-related amidase